MRIRRRAGRPLRFLALTLGGWATARIVLLWPMAAPVDSLVAPPPMLAASVDPARWLSSPADRGSVEPWPIGPSAIGRGAPVATLTPFLPRRGGQLRSPPSPAMVALALAAMVRYGPAVATGPSDQAGMIPSPLRPLPIATGRSRLAGSAWLIARGGGGATRGGGALTGGQLGASQAGARLTYALGPETEGARRVALSARIATPLRGRGAEAAVGIDWQPTRLPLHLLAEERVPLDGGRGGPALLLVGGIGPTPVGGGLRLEGYAQAGAIARGRDAGGIEAFGDGGARLTHPVANLGPVHLDLGAGAWGAAQRDARRLDLGPTLGAVVPVATKAMRITLDWRQRIAGNARPGSGPALSIGTDF